MGYLLFVLLLGVFILQISPVAFGLYLLGATGLYLLKKKSTIVIPQ